MHPEKITRRECETIISLSSIMGLRMLGLFMVLPVFAWSAQQLHGATPFLVGLAMGIYGLFQALLQIPFGALSDRIGRKPIIVFGFILFIIGSLVAASASTITLMIVGRALQGMGAVGSTLLALMADLTSEKQRTKAMAIAGISIGFSFSLAMFAGPVLMQWLSINQLFLLAGLFGGIAIFILLMAVPTPSHTGWQRDAEPEWRAFLKLLIAPELAKLNGGIFILHAIFTASFVVIPMSLFRFTHLPSHQQWIIYLPALLVAFAITLFCIGQAERKNQIKPYFLAGIITLAIAELVLWLGAEQLRLTAIAIGLFFTGFSLLEAFLPSLVSRMAPAGRKGSALGIYSCAQFFGIFVGGVFGGLLYGTFSFMGVYLFCIALALIWLVLAILMQPPRYLITKKWRLPALQPAAAESLVAKLRVIPGMVEVIFIAEDSVAYLKMERETLKDPRFIEINEQTQSE